MKTTALIVLLLSFLEGLIGRYFFPQEYFSGADLLFSLLIALAIYHWYRADAEQRAYRRPALMNLGILALTIVGLPWYLFRTRGLKGGTLATLAYLLLLAFSTLSAAGGERLAQHMRSASEVQL